MDMHIIACPDYDLDAPYVEGDITYWMCVYMQRHNSSINPGQDSYKISMQACKLLIELYVKPLLSWHLGIRGCP